VKLTEFEGTWRITRQIKDHRLSRLGQLTGTAVFTPGPDGMIYTETGTLRFPGQPDLSAKQSYLWSESGLNIQVKFSDGREFHSIDLTTQTPNAHHHCPPDDYRVTYDFTDWPNWSSRWIVSGPSKDYAMTTLFTHQP